MAEVKTAQVPQRVQLISEATSSVYGIDMRVAPDAKEVFLVTACEDKKVRLYSSALTQSNPHFQLRSVVTHKSIVGVVQFNQTCTSLLSADDGGKLIISDVHHISSPKQITVFDHPKDIAGACWSSSGDAIISACRDNTIRIFDMNKKSSKQYQCKTYMIPSKGKLRSMVCSGNTIVVGDSKGWLFRVMLQNPSNVTSKIQAHDSEIPFYNGVDMLDDGICVSAGWTDKSVCVWDMKSNKTEKILHASYVYAVHVPLKGAHLLFSACRDGYVRLYDQKCNPTRELFKVKTARNPICVTSCALPGQQGGLFAVGCYSPGPCEVYRWLSLSMDKVCMSGVDVCTSCSIQT